MSDELKLYKLLTEPNEDDFSYIQEMGWVSNDEFCVWISYVWIDDFVRDLRDIFGYGVFDEGGFDARMQEYCICIDLCVALGCYLDLEEIFPKDRYEH